ncbi:MAG: glycosyltransferase family 2 protein, partial [Luteimonas sp.]
MTSLPAAVFWICIGMVAYAYAGYPLLAAWLSRLQGAEPDIRGGRDIPSMTVIVAAYNEEPRIAARVLDILAQEYPTDCLHVIVVSDGSSDRTAQAATLDDPRVRVLSLVANGGKASALNAAMSMATTELVAFTDARQRYAPGALRALAAAFADPRVGAASGELVIEDAAHDQANRGASSQGVGLYWRMEKRLRSDEARLHWLHGVSGAVYALRRELFRAIPAGTILDDMWVPLQVVLADRWVWMARDAVAYDTASANAREEFGRKLRTLAGNWQLIARLP